MAALEKSWNFFRSHLFVTLLPFPFFLRSIFLWQLFLLFAKQTHLVPIVDSDVEHVVEFVHNFKL